MKKCKCILKGTTYRKGTSKTYCKECDGEIEGFDPYAVQFESGVELAVDDTFKEVFTITPVLDEMTASEALFGFCGWLTCRTEKTVMSASDDAAGIADLVGLFCKVNRLEDPRIDWQDNLRHPSEQDEESTTK